MEKNSEIVKKLANKFKIDGLNSVDEFIKILEELENKEEEKIIELSQYIGKCYYHGNSYNKYYCKINHINEDHLLADQIYIGQSHGGIDFSVSHYANQRHHIDKEFLERHTEISLDEYNKEVGKIKDLMKYFKIYPFYNIPFEPKVEIKL